VSSALAPPHPEPAPVAKLAEPRLTNNALFAGTCGALLFSPLAFGAVEPWSVFVLEACSLLLFVLWAYRQWINRQIDVSDNPLYRPMAAFFALALLQQMFGTTAYRQVTYSHLLLYAAYGMLVFVATQTLRRSSQFEMMAKLFTAYGAVVAFFAVLEGLAPNGKLYWIWTVEHGGTIYGPYVNHNHYAGLMEMLTPFPLVLAVTRFTDGNRKIVVAGIAALMAASIFLSGSRGGMTAFAAQMVVLGVVVLRKRDTGWKQPLILGAFLTLVIVFLVWMGGNEVTRRLLSIHSETRQEITGGTRFTIDRDCLHMLLKKPFLGWGLGTFPIVYPEFRSFYTTFFVNQAHNDYLQLLVETGLAGFAIAIWFLALVFRGAVRKLKNLTKSDGNETASGALTLAALLGCVGILVHSFFDFNLQVPANAALFYFLCAIAAAAPLQESQRRRALRRRHRLVVEPTPESAPS
jgi:O-antigen ligase